MKHFKHCSVVEVGEYENPVVNFDLVRFAKKGLAREAPSIIFFFGGAQTVAWLYDTEEARDKEYLELFAR